MRIKITCTEIGLDTILTNQNLIVSSIGIQRDVPNRGRRCTRTIPDNGGPEPGSDRGPLMRRKIIVSKYRRFGTTVPRSA